MKDSQSPTEINNPHSWRAKKNNLQKFIIALFYALNLEFAQNLRMKAILKAFIPEKKESHSTANKTINQKLSASNINKSKPQEIDLLSKLFNAVKEVVKNTLSKAKNKAIQKIQSKKKNGDMSEQTAGLLSTLAEKFFSEEHLQKAAKSLKKPTPAALTEKEIKSVDKDFQDIIRSANTRYKNTTSSGPIPERLKARSDLTALLEIVRDIRLQRLATQERMQFKRHHHIVLPGIGVFTTICNETESLFAKHQDAMNPSYFTNISENMMFQPAHNDKPDIEAIFSNTFDLG